MTDASGWIVEHHAGPASELLALSVPDPPRRTVRILAVERAALVLGSAQPDADVDAAAAVAAGIDVVRRRSGGGAVLLQPGDVVWVDAILPAGDPRWDPDIGRAFHWLGRAWVTALGALGLDARWNSGAPERTAWSDRICFAGLGPGEVSVGGRKVVGLSQRRMRTAALFQCAALLAWEPAALLGLLAGSTASEPAALAELEAMAMGLGRAVRDQLLDAFRVAIGQ